MMILMRNGGRFYEIEQMSVKTLQPFLKIIFLDSKIVVEEILRCIKNNKVGGNNGVVEDRVIERILVTIGYYLTECCR